MVADKDGITWSPPPQPDADGITWAPPPERGPGIVSKAVDTARDLAVGTVQGVATGIPQIAVGLGNMVSHGAVDRGYAGINELVGQGITAVGNKITGQNVEGPQQGDGTTLSQGLNQISGEIGKYASERGQAAMPDVHKVAESGRQIGKEFAGNIGEKIGGETGRSVGESIGDVAGGFAGGIAGAVQNPAGLPLFIGQSAPTMAAAGAGFGAVAASVGRKEFARASAEAAAKGLAGAEAKTFAKKAAESAVKEFSDSTLGKTTYAISEGAVGGGQNASQAEAEIRDKPQAELEKLQPYKDLIAAGKTPQEARDKLAADVTTATALISGALSSLASPLSSKFNRALGAKIAGGEYAGGVVSQRGLLPALRTAGAEAGQETIQSGLEQVGQNIGMRQADPNQDLFDQVGEQAGLGGIAGGILGGGAHPFTAGHEAPVTSPAAPTVPGTPTAPAPTAEEAFHAQFPTEPPAPPAGPRFPLAKPNALPEINDLPIITSPEAAQAARLQQFAAQGSLSAAAASVAPMWETPSEALPAIPATQTSPEPTASASAPEVPGSVPGPFFGSPPVQDRAEAQRMADATTERTGRPYEVLPHPTEPDAWQVAPVPGSTSRATPQATKGAQQGASVAPKVPEMDSVAKYDAITELAKAAATSPTNDLAHPTSGQTTAGNYKKAHIPSRLVDGLGNVTLENPKDSVRVAADGSWAANMPYHYGYIRGVEGADGDKMDIAIGPGKNLYVINQKNPETGKFDEHKLMKGFDSPEQAKEAYMAAYPADWKGFQSIVPISVDGAKSWFDNGDRTKALTRQESARAEGGAVRAREILGTPGEWAGLDLHGAFSDARPVVPMPHTGESNALTQSVPSAIHSAIHKNNGVVAERPSTQHAGMVSGLLREAKRLGVPKSVSDGINHIFTYKQDAGNALYYGGSGAIGINAHLLDAAVRSPKVATELVGKLGHELTHHIDRVGAGPYVSASPEADAAMGIGHTDAGWIATGHMMKEAVDAFYDGPEELQKLFTYPFGMLKYKPGERKGRVSATTLREEAFAQMGALFIGNPKLMQKEMPQSYATFKEIFDAAKSVTSIGDVRSAVRAALRARPNAVGVGEHSTRGDTGETAGRGGQREAGAGVGEQPRADKLGREVATLDDFKSGNVSKINEKSDWAVITAENPANKTATAQDNADANAKLEADLKAGGYDYTAVTGKYGGPEENSFVVTGISPEDARALRDKYGQDSILTNQGFEHADGSITPSTGVMEHPSDAEDYYTQMPDGTKWASQIDWDNKIEAPKFSKPKPKNGVEETPGLKQLSGGLTDRERVRLDRGTAKRLVEFVHSLGPNVKEMSAVALAGIAKRGWYKRGVRSIVHVFGPDAPRFAALLAAISPRTTVEENLRMTTAAWAEWIKEGRPMDGEKIHRILARTAKAQGDDGMVLKARVYNAIRALTMADPSKIVLSGPKVDSFYNNLIGDVNEVTNDGWMAAYAAIDSKILGGGGILKSGESGRPIPYLGMSVLARLTAKRLTKLTGEIWTPAEVQETVWSWVKTLSELADAKGETRTPSQLLADGAVTDALIASTPDFGTLLNEDQFGKFLRKAGYGDKLDSLAAIDYGTSGTKVSEAGGKATPAPDQAQLRRAAKRLTELQTKRKESALSNAEQAELDKLNSELSLDAKVRAEEAANDRDVRFSLPARVVGITSAAFKKWFGTSKIVDKNGNPLRVYHGTVSDFTKFLAGKAYEFGNLGKAFYFTNSTEDASYNYADLEGGDTELKIIELAEELYAEGLSRSDARAKAIEQLSDNEGVVLPVYLSMKRPFIIGGPDGMAGDHPDLFVWNPRKRVYENNAADLPHALQKLGFDGIIDNTVYDKFGGHVGNMDESTTHYLVFNPTQIKSAIGNRGSYSKTNPDIRYKLPNAETPVAAALHSDIVRWKNSISRTWKNAPDIVVLRSPSEAPFAAPEEAYGAIHAGTVYLFSNNLNSVELATHTLLHEVKGHYGLKGIFGDSLSPLLRSIYDTNEGVRALADQKMVQHGYTQSIATEEALADLAGENKLSQLKGYKILVAAIRNGLRKLGFAINFSDNDIAAILSASSKFVETGEKTASSEALKTAFSERAPTFYSALEANLLSSKQASAPPEQWKAILQKFGKPEELKWTGVNEWLDLQKGKVTREQVLDFVRNNGVKVEEVVLGSEGTPYEFDDAEKAEDFSRSNPAQGFDAGRNLEIRKQSSGQRVDSLRVRASAAEGRSIDPVRQLPAPRRQELPRAVADVARRKTDTSNCPGYRVVPRSEVPSIHDTG